MDTKHTRQSKFKRVVNDPDPNPTFDDIWTHTEGFVVNAGDQGEVVRVVGSRESRVGRRV